MVTGYRLKVLERKMGASLLSRLAIDPLVAMARFFIIYLVLGGPVGGPSPI